MIKNSGLKSGSKAELLLVFATMMAGCGWIFSKQSIEGIPPFAFIGIRFVTASLILMPLCLSALTQLAMRDVMKAAFAGLLQGVVLLLWIYSVSVTDALGEGAFIMSLSMLFAPLMAWPLMKQKPGKCFWQALPVAVLGLYMLSGGGEWHTSASQITFLIAALTLALQFNLNGLYVKSIPVLPLTCLQFLSTGLLAVLVSLLAESWPQSVDTSVWYWVCASILPATCLRFLAQIAGQKHTSASNAAIIMILEPLWTVMLSMTVYGEQMSFHKVTGCLLILTSLVVYKLRDRKRQRSGRLAG
ncbi:putative DMT superfamily transporter inner membrane protein [Vibrio aerogenes CECT 7868]|uniref:Putative DMT superfamily transporter inner membrane protein n=1 Tax=Vibrio aerogenes CECT 7868 TaxID=1216006 RepID=A0A1M5VCU2_9VIBR|nr:DMT family transporter [Vibrio aerogenes]SHH73026.1 putative DMT superfamily transporter inner membrane protein [Vibrio aerogenes CECT 7868]